MDVDRTAELRSQPMSCQQSENPPLTQDRVSYPCSYHNTPTGVCEIWRANLAEQNPEHCQSLKLFPQPCLNVKVGCCLPLMCSIVCTWRSEHNHPCRCRVVMCIIQHLMGRQQAWTKYPCTTASMRPNIASQRPCLWVCHSGCPECMTTHLPPSTKHTR